MQRLGSSEHVQNCRQTPSLYRQLLHVAVHLLFDTRSWRLSFFLIRAAPGVNLQLTSHFAFSFVTQNASCLGTAVGQSMDPLSSGSKWIPNWTATPSLLTTSYSPTPRCRSRPWLHNMMPLGQRLSPTDVAAHCCLRRPVRVAAQTHSRSQPSLRHRWSLIDAVAGPFRWPHRCGVARKEC